MTSAAGLCGRGDNDGNGNAAVCSLEDYTSFHAMLCRPGVARRCIDSFRDGKVLFMPSSYRTDNAGGPQEGGGGDNSDGGSGSSSCFGGRRGDYDHYNHGKNCRLYNNCPLSVLSYYLLVLVSCTGLSSLLGLTKLSMSSIVGGGGGRNDDIDNIVGGGSNHIGATKRRQQRKDDDGVVIDLHEPLVSPTFPYLRLDPSAYPYLLMDENNDDNIDNRVGDSIDDDNDDDYRFPAHKRLVLKRRFEFSFGGLVPVDVVMWHIAAVDGSSRSNSSSKRQQNDPSNNRETKTTLHLVEIYKIRNPVMRHVSRWLDFIIKRWFLLSVLRFVDRLWPLLFGGGATKKTTTATTPTKGNRDDNRRKQL